MNKPVALAVAPEKIQIIRGVMVGTIRADEIVELSADFRDRVITYYSIPIGRFLWSELEFRSSEPRPVTLGTKRVVRIAWRRSEPTGLSTGSEIFDSHGNEYKALLDEMQNAAGKSWVDLP